MWPRVCTPWTLLVPSSSLWCLLHQYKIHKWCNCSGLIKCTRGLLTFPLCAILRSLNQTSVAPHVKCASGIKGNRYYIYMHPVFPGCFSGCHGAPNTLYSSLSSNARPRNSVRKAWLINLDVSSTPQTRTRTLMIVCHNTKVQWRYIFYTWSIIQCAPLTSWATATFFLLHVP